MSKRKHRCATAVVVAAVLPAVAGVADANTVPVEKDTVDGYHLSVSIGDVNIQSVPNMAAAPFVREGFVTATSRLTVVCNEGPSKNKCLDTPVTAALRMTAQIGCPTDISGGVVPGVTPSGISSVPVGQILGLIQPPPTPVPTPGPTDVTDIGLLPTGTIASQLGFKPLPGFIRDVDLGEMKFPLGDSSSLISRLDKSIDLADKAADLDKSLAPSRTEAMNRAADVLKNAVRLNSQPLEVSVQNFHLEVDDNENQLGVCGGVVAIRIYAQGRIQTSRSVDTVDIYGDIFSL